MNRLVLPNIVKSQKIQNLIIAQIRDLIRRKNLDSGDKLPSERALSEKFGVSRNSVREALSKLETYELVKSIPQSGTIIANIGQNVLLGIIDDILDLKHDNFNSLVETRIHLELKTAKLAAERSTKKDLKQIEKKFKQYESKALKGEDAMQEDILFHLAIAKASGNPTLNTLMLQITPKLISVFEYNRIINVDKYLPDHSRKIASKQEKELIKLEIERHGAIYESIKNQDPQRAVKSMEIHFEEMLKKIE